MKLKSFVTVSSASKVNYTVWKKGTYKNKVFDSDCLIESFKVDYLNKNTEELTRNIIKRQALINRGADVVNISVYKDWLELSVEI